jgi:hypothetical protein
MHTASVRAHTDNCGFLFSREADVVYAGAAPGAVNGLIQINAVVPEGVPRGAAVPISVRFGPYESPAGTTLPVAGPTQSPSGVSGPP